MRRDSAVVWRKRTRVEEHGNRVCIAVGHGEVHPAVRVEIAVGHRARSVSHQERDVSGDGAVADPGEDRDVVGKKGGRGQNRKTRAC